MQIHRDFPREWAKDIQLAYDEIKGDAPKTPILLKKRRELMKLLRRVMRSPEFQELETM